MDVETYTVQVPVKVLGEPLGESRKFKVNVNKDLTTAPEDVYTLLPGEFVMDKDSVNAYIPIELLRSKIDPMVDTVYRIVLDLEVNDEFGLGVKEKCRVRWCLVIICRNRIGGMLWSSCTGGLIVRKSIRK